MKIKGVHEEEVKIFLEKNYNLEIIEIDYHPIGENSVSYIIKTKKKKYFAKVFGKGPEYRSIRKIKIYINFLYEINKKYNFNYAPFPIQNKNKNLISRFNGFPVILEKFLPGKNPKNFTKLDYKILGKILGELHNISPSKFGKIRKELLNLRWESKILKIIKSIKDKELKYGGEIELKKILQIKEETFRNAVKFLKNNKNLITNRERNYVVVHEDIHPGNIIKNKKELHLIDWEGVQLALPERDLMWFRKGLGLNSDFEKEYGKYREKNYKINKKIIKFYTIKRLLSDITYFSGGIIFRKESAREERGYLRGIQSEIQELEETLKL